jgi:uncharacterized surface anchored protein
MRQNRKKDLINKSPILRFSAPGRVWSQRAIMKASKILALFLAAIICWVVFPQASSADSPPQDLTDQNTYLVIHETTGSYAGLGGPSTILVTDPDGATISPIADIYRDVPLGSNLSLKYVFHLNDGDGTSLYSYAAGSYFTFLLPEGMTFTAVPGSATTIQATDSITGNLWTIGTWELLADGRTVRVNFSDDINNHQARWAAILINGTFSEEVGQEGLESTFSLGTQTVTFVRELPPPPEIALAKSGVYDANTNTITWTVNVTPPNGVPLSGYLLSDSYSGNQAYVGSSFQVNGLDVPDINLDFESNKVIYTFPDPTNGDQVITYKTSPTTFSAETGANSSAERSNFTNTASILRGTETIKGPVEASVAVDWLNKVGAVESASEYVMRWTINIFVPTGATLTGVSVKDTLSSGHEMINTTPYTASYTVGTDAPLDFTAGLTTGQYSVSGQEVTFELGDLNASTSIVYYTKISDPENSLNTNGTVTFRNDAALTWDQLPEGTSTEPSDGTSVGIVGSGGLLTKAAGSTTNFGTGKDIIYWTITVNRNQVTIQDAAITDTIPDGQQLLIDSAHPFIVLKNGVNDFQTASAAASGGLSSSDGFVRNYSYTFPDEDPGTPGNSISSTYTVRFYTQITDTSSGLVRLYVNNNSVNYQNGVTLSRTSSGGSVTTTGTQTFRSQMIAKSVAIQYNYTDRSTQWRLVINRNQLPLTNAVITDTLPAGMELLIGSAYPFQVVRNGTTNTIIANSPTTGADGSNSFTVELPTPTSEQYTITFYTRVTDEALLSQGQSSKTYTNLARLDSDEAVNLTASANISVGNPVIIKSYNYTPGTDVIDWSVAINAGQVPLYNAVVTDGLNDALELIPTSLKLYTVSVASNGTVNAASTGVLVDTANYGVVMPTTANGNVLQVQLPEGSQAYRLEFSTYILTNDLDAVNVVSLDGSNGDPSGTANSANIAISNLWSSGGSGSYVLSVYKSDGAGNPVPGATYRLLSMNLSPILRDGNPVDVITDENGYALFTNLPAWIFYVLEVNPPAGYLLNTTFLGGERLSEDLFIETSDQFALGTITLAKEAANGTPLSGGTFTLTGTDYNSDPIQRTATSKNGVVTFSDLPLGEYSVRETTAPTGYTLSNTEITAIVEYNSTKTEVVVTITSENDTIVNDPLPYGSIELYKTDGSDPLAGAVFELYTTNGDTVGTATSDSSGRVRFTRVPLGSYSIREITAPNGYARSSIIAIAQITENDYATTVRADPYSIVNQWIEIPKTGDEANPWLWAGVAVFAIVGVIFLLIFRRISAHAEGNNNNMV